MTSDRNQEAGAVYSHRSVLLDSAVDYLVNDPDGYYVDGTFGRGGHSRLILGRLGESGQLLGIDKDPEAIRAARELEAQDSRFHCFHGSFAELGAALAGQGWQTVNGVLLDLGVSSPQLDDASRGFSFMRDGPLDMRMNTEQSPSAAEWLATAEESDIANVIFRYGEERFSRRIARLLVERRQEAPVETTRQLAELVSEAVPKKEKHKHPATRTFQAIRIFINRELEDLEIGLQSAVDHLAPGGRLVVISFHSLEDRLVKRFMRDLARGPQLPKGVPVTAEQEASDFRLVGKASKAGADEVSDNVRARSAVMRVLERTDTRKKLAGERVTMGAVAIEEPVKTAKLNKQMVRDGVATAVRISRQVFAATKQGRVLVSLGLVAVLLASSIGVVVSAHENRELFNTLSQLQSERDRYQSEWSQLLLEQSALSAHGRVEKLAAERFGMVVPGRQDIVLVPLMSPVADR